MNRFIWHLLSSKQRKKRLQAQGLSIGDGCEILNGWDFGSEPYLVEIGENVRIASGVKITTHDGGAWVLRHLYPDLADADRFGRVLIGDNCHIGVNACILPGVSIGSNSIVGAGAIVTKNVPEGSVVAGVPARQICTIEEYRAKHAREFLPTKPLGWEEKRRYVERWLQSNA